MNLWIPLGLAAASLVAMVIYVLAQAVRQLSNQVTQINERLLVLLGTKERPDIGRALVASAKEPRRAVPGIAAGNAENPKKPGVTHTIGFGV